MSKYRITKELFTDKMNILIYGDPGVGKTHLAGTAQDCMPMKDVHFFNIDGGMMTLADRGDIDATDIKSVDELENELYRLINKDPEYKGVKTIVIDNISELQTLCLEGITTAEFKERQKKNKNYTIDDVYLEDYGKSGKQLARVLRGYRDLPMHTIYLAHKKDKMRKGTNVLESSIPSLTDKLCTAVCGYMDFVWYLYTNDDVVTEGEEAYTVTNRYLLTQPYDCYMAKTRGSTFADMIGSVIQNPNLADILNIYLKGAKENGK